MKMLAAIDGIQDLTMTTNGILLARHARSLAVAGLNRVNVSLDAMAPDRFAASREGAMYGKCWRASRRHVRPN